MRGLCKLFSVIVLFFAGCISCLLLSGLLLCSPVHLGTDGLAVVILFAVVFYARDIPALTRRNGCPACGWGYRLRRACARCDAVHPLVSTRWRWWCCFAGACLLVIAMSGFRCSTERWWLCMNGGWLMLHHGWHSRAFEVGYQGWPHLNGATVLPVGLVPAILMLPAMSLLLYKWLCLSLPVEGFVPGHCRRCGYDLTGNVSGVCPECGTKAHVRQTEAEARTAYEKAVNRSAELRESALFCLACLSTGASVLLLIRSMLLGRAIGEGLRDQTPLWILVPLLWLAYADQRRR